MSRRHVLITRPAQDCGALSAALTALGYQVTCQPFLKVVLHQKVALPDLAGFAALIFTSANGVRGFVQNSDRRDIDVYVVGQNTAEIAEENGFQLVHSAQGNVRDLAAMVRDAQADKPFLYVRGRDVSADLVALCRPVRVQEVISYHTEFIEEKLDWEEFTDVIFFSRRTAQAFVGVMNQQLAGGENQGMMAGLKRCKALCLGPSMVESLSVLPWCEIQVAHTPNRDGMLRLLDNKGSTHE